MILFPMLMISVLLTRNAKIASVFLQAVIATKAYQTQMIFAPEDKNAKNANVWRQAASVTPMLSILMNCAPGMSNVLTVNVSHLDVTVT